MSDTGASTLIGGLFGLGKNNGAPNLQGLQQAGYSQYQPGQAPGLNMGAYGPDQTTNANAAQIDMGQADLELGNQQSLIAQLQAQAQGTGPNLAAQQLRQGTQNNLASQLALAAGQRGNQNPGAERMQLANSGAATNQAEAGQAAQLRGQEQLASEQGLGSALGQVSSQQQQLANSQAGLNQAANLQNASAANNMAEFNTGSAQAGNAAQQAQYQFLQNLQAQQQSNQNAAIAGQQLSAQNAQQQGASGLLGGALNAGGAALGSYVKGGSSSTPNTTGAQPVGGVSSAPTNVGSDGSTTWNDGSSGWSEAKGGIDRGEEHLIGEAGPEAEVPVHETHVHLHGQVVDKPTVGPVGSPAHAVAVVPLTPGAPMDEHVKELLAHPDFQKAVAKVVSHHADALKAAFESRRK